MTKKRHTAEQIVMLLRQVEVAVGKTPTAATKSNDVAIVFSIGYQL